MKHNYGHGCCPHQDCGGTDLGVSGYQCADCGHYFSLSRLVMGGDSEYYCRAGMGHNTADGLRQARTQA